MKLDIISKYFLYLYISSYIPVYIVIQNGLIHVGKSGFKCLQMLRKIF